MLLDVTLPIELHNRNTGRGSAHWKSTNERKDIEATLRLLGHVRTPFAFPVGLTIVRLLAGRQRFIDTDSVGRGNAKELIDSLVACGWFVDDKPEHIRAVHYMQDERGKKLRRHGETRIIVWRMDGTAGALSPECVRATAAAGVTDHGGLIDERIVARACQADHRRGDRAGRKRGREGSASSVA
jgi:hypothetical protein